MLTLIHLAANLTREVQDAVGHLLAHGAPDVSSHELGALLPVINAVSPTFKLPECRLTFQNPQLPETNLDASPGTKALLPIFFLFNMELSTFAIAEAVSIRRCSTSIHALTGVVARSVGLVRSFDGPLSKTPGCLNTRPHAFGGSSNGAKTDR